MAVKNSITKAVAQKLSLTEYLNQDAIRNHIYSVVGGQRGPTFIAGLVSAVTVNEALKGCTPQSLLSASLLGEALKLTPSPSMGMYYMVPFKAKEKRDKDGNIIKPACMEAQFQLGYRGYIQLAARSGQYKKLNAIAIKEGELVRYDALNEEIEVNLIEDEEKREQAKTIGYYAFFEYLNGFRKAIYWSKAKMEHHASTYSQGYAAKKGYTFWEKNFDEMARKTMLRQLISKWGIMSIELEKAYTTDQAVIGEDGSPNYVDFDEDPIEEAVNEVKADRADDPTSVLFGEGNA